LVEADIVRGVWRSRAANQIALRTRDVRVGIMAHVLLNATDLIVLLGYLHTR
jgi:hypothetical protein